jgi:hypothetical protein
MIRVFETNFPVVGFILVNTDKVKAILFEFCDQFSEGGIKNEDLESFLRNNSVISNRVYKTLKKEGAIPAYINIMTDMEEFNSCETATSSLLLDSRVYNEYKQNNE